MARLNDKRQRLVQAANQLIFNNSFNLTTLALIAVEAQVPLGNVYYYFKTKEEILKAVLKLRINQIESLFAEWETISKPVDRLMAFTSYYLNKQDETLQAGCQFGSLALELGKQNNPLSQDAAQIMEMQIQWADKQLAELGISDSAAKARQFIAWLQGVALLACSLQDAQLHAAQLNSIKQWLQELT